MTSVLSMMHGRTIFFYSFIKQSYLLFSKSYIDTINSIEGIDEKTKERVAFFHVRPSMPCPQVILSRLTRSWWSWLWREWREPSWWVRTVASGSERAPTSLRFAWPITTHSDWVWIPRIQKVMSSFKNDLFELIQYHTQRHHKLMRHHCWSFRRLSISTIFRPPWKELDDTLATWTRAQRIYDVLAERVRRRKTKNSVTMSRKVSLRRSPLLKTLPAKNKSMRQVIVLAARYCFYGGLLCS